MILRLTTCHENALSPLGERVGRDGAFTSRRESGEGVRVCYFHGSEESGSALLRIDAEMREVQENTGARFLACARNDSGARYRAATTDNGQLTTDN